MLYFTKWASLIFLFGYGVSAQNLESIDLDANQLLKSYRLGGKAPQPSRLLQGLSEAIQTKQWDKCLEKFSKGLGFSVNVKPWMQFYWLQCARESVVRGGKLQPLLTALDSVEKNDSWFLAGGQKDLLKKEYVSSMLVAVKKVSAQNRERGWKLFDRLQNYKSDIAPPDLAEVYKAAGEMAFVQQNLQQAAHFFQQSLSIQPNEDLKKKLALISAKIGDESAPAKGSVELKPELIFSEEERKILTRFRAGIKSSDFSAAVSDGVSLLNDYPGSQNRKEVSDTIIRVYLSTQESQGRNLEGVRSRLESEMQKAPYSEQYSWAQTLMARGNYGPARIFLQAGYEKSKGSEESTSILRTLARVCYTLGEIEDAENYYQTLVKSHPGGDASVEALVYLGLSYFKRKEFSKAASQFERVLAVTSESKYRVTAIYYLWRSLQQAKEARADEVRLQMLSEYPLTYYGLRTRLESPVESGTPPWGTEKTSFKTRMYLSPQNRKSWRAYLELMQAGFYRSAEQELKAITFSDSVSDMLIQAILAAQVFDYDRTFSIMTDLMDREKSLRTVDIIRFVYPREFNKEVEPAAKTTGFDPDFVLSLMRQESSFDPVAQSPAQALGLMQLQVPTAKEMAGQLKAKFDFPQDLYQPAKNIQLGTQYLKHMLKKFDGNLPVTLAAYNVGPTRFRRWIKIRPDGEKIMKTKTSDPFFETWIEEMPWEESRIYVKSILRNYLIYSWLYKNAQPSTVDPIWQKALVSSP